MRYLTILCGFLLLGADRYVGPSGVEYEYDLRSPSDRIRYSVDKTAQIRDRLSVDPRVRIDDGLGQPGGGVYGQKVWKSEW